MHLSRLSTAEMLSLSQGFLLPEHPANQALVALPEMTSLLVRLREVHQILLASQSPDDVRANSLQQEILSLDAEHDELVRGIDHLCRGAAHTAEDAETRERWDRLRELLLPGGHDMAELDYAVQAGNAALLEPIFEGLPAADKKLLKGMVSGKRSLFEIVERWIGVGKELGQKEMERQSVPVTPTDAALRDARHQWARIVGAMVSMLHLSELLGELAPAIKQHVLGPLRAATDKGTPTRIGRETLVPSGQESGSSSEPQPS